MPDELRFNLDAPLGPSHAQGLKPGQPPEALGRPEVTDTASGVAVEGRHVLDYVRVLYKRRWLATFAFVVVVVINTVYTYTRVPIYQASARLLVQAQRQNYGFTDITPPEPPDFQTQFAMLRSRSAIKKTMQSLHIWQETAPSKESGTTAIPENQKREVVKSSLAARFNTARKLVVGFFGASASTSASADGSPEDEQTAAEARQIEGFLSGVGVSPVPGSSIVDISYTSTDPVLTARYANALARQYVDQSLEQKSLATKEVSEWLSERIIEQREKVEASEQALRRYLENNAAVALDESETHIMQSLSELATNVTRAKADRIEKEALYNQFRAIQNDRAALESLPAVQLNPAVQQAKTDLAAAQRNLAQLSEKLGERHPDLIRARQAVKAAEERIPAEIARVVESNRLDVEKARATEASLTRTLEDQKRMALASKSNGSGLELAVLQRDVQSNRQVFEIMMDRARAAGLSSEIKTNNVRILDLAEVPRAPIAPNTNKNLQYGVLGGLIFGVGLAFFFEYLDNRIKSPEEIRTHLGVAFLGLVPGSHKRSGPPTTPLITSGVPPSFAEAFRVVRTNVLFSSAEESARSVLVASAGPGEGKTLVASNLAIALAQAGQRVLIIDGDLRRPRLHDVFSVKQEPGLSNLIVGDAKAADVFRASQVGVTVLPSGRIPPNPAELLGSKRFKDLLARLGEHFDWIVIDSPPVMVVTDPMVVAHIVSGVLFVVSADATSRHTARTAIDQLVTSRAHVLGAVLNRVDLDKNGYYYSQYYKREYNEYYTASRPSA